MSVSWPSPEGARSLLTVEDVAQVVGLSTESVRRAIRVGELPASKMRRRIRVKSEDVAAWIEATRVEPVRLDIPRGLPAPPVRRGSAPLGGYQQRAKDAA